MSCCVCLFTARLYCAIDQPNRAIRPALYRMSKLSRRQHAVSCGWPVADTGRQHVLITATHQAQAGDCLVFSENVKSLSAAAADSRRANTTTCLSNYLTTTELLFLTAFRVPIFFDDYLSTGRCL